MEGLGALAAGEAAPHSPLYPLDHPLELPSLKEVPSPGCSPCQDPSAKLNAQYKVSAHISQPETQMGHLSFRTKGLN